MFTIKDAIDAAEPLTFRVEADDCCKATARSAGGCVQAIALDRSPGVRKAHVFRNIGYVWREGDELPTRYQLGSRARQLAMVNDIEHSKAALLRWLKHNGNEITFYPPRRRVSLSYLRSPEAKQGRAESLKRRRNQTKRAYRKPKAIGLRHGGGLAHVWEDNLEA